MLSARRAQPVSATASASASSGATVIMTAFSATLCCANVEGAPISSDNPAVPGEIVYVYGTGLGLPAGDVGASLQTGTQWPAGQRVTSPMVAVSAIAGGKTADVLSATLLPGTVGTYLVVLHLNGDIPTQPATAITVAQDIYVSNVVHIPVVNITGQ